MRRMSRVARVITGVAAALLVATVAGLGARQAGGGVAIDKDDIGGVVTGAKGPEAGVWVIAETQDLPTRFIRIVVTDDRGRYVIPDLPAATYDVWVRGYGLVDSPKVKAGPGKLVDLKAVPAPNARAAAEYYPANYWYSLLEPPPQSEFPGTGRRGNGISERITTQGEWIGQMKMNLGCTQCHQMGTKITRELTPMLKTKFTSSVEAWDYRVQMGISGAFMSSSFGPLGRKTPLAALASWSDRIAAGEVPQAPPRPAGLERNIVVTQWEWSIAKNFVHDSISTDRHNPTVNAYGPLVGVEELSGDWIAVLDPVKHTEKRIPVPVHDDSLPYAWAQDMPEPSAFWGDEIIWKGKLAPHNPMFDGKGRVWVTARGGCRVYEPKTDKVTHIPECPGNGGHLQLAADGKMWFGGAYFDIKKWDETGDAKAAAFRFTGTVIDTNGNGKADLPGVSSREPMDPSKDWQRAPGGYSLAPNRLDGSVWYSVLGIPGAITRLDPKTNLLEVYEPPYNNPKAKMSGYLPHGIDINERTGVIWVGLNSGHYAEFDRRKCQVLNGPAATGQHCPEGWTLHVAPGPNFKTVEWPGSADSYYLNWVDWKNTGGYGENVPMLVGSGSDSLMAFVDGKWVVMRVPYPMGFHPRGMDGRIDDPKAGWKGRGLWTTHSEQPTWHQEGGKSERPKAIHFQLRPNPLAK